MLGELSMKTSWKWRSEQVSGQGEGQVQGSQVETVVKGLVPWNPLTC